MGMRRLSGNGLFSPGETFKRREESCGGLTLCHVNSPLKKKKRSYILRSISLFSGFDVRLLDLYKKLLRTFAFYNCLFI